LAYMVMPNTSSLSSSKAVFARIVAFMTWPLQHLGLPVTSWEHH
jgi:hypothetical protein